MQNKDLRDEFAMAALTGLLATPKDIFVDGIYSDIDIYKIAEISYQIADAMLAAKKKTLKDKVEGK